MIIIDNSHLEGIIKEADTSARKRKHKNFHLNYSEKVQRLINVIHRDSYIRPHRHKDPEKFEVFIILKGKAAVIEFDEAGNIVNQVILYHPSGNFAVEIPPRSYHTIVSLEDGSSVYEIKQGPYIPEDDKEFAAWAPGEGSSEAVHYLNKLRENIIQQTSS